MKKYLLLGAAALSLIAAAPAMAAPHNQGKPQAQTQHYHGPSKAQPQKAQPQKAQPQKVQPQKYQQTQRFYYNGRQYNSFRAPAWQAPKGYYQRSWKRGQYLPANYRTRSYVIDHRAYHLRPAPVGYSWVRVNNDVFLVSNRTGYINQIVFSLFFR